MELIRQTRSKRWNSVLREIRSPLESGLGYVRRTMFDSEILIRGQIGKRCPNFEQMINSSMDIWLLV